jgi:hypothetical protein
VKSAQSFASRQYFLKSSASSMLGILFKVNSKKT